MMRFSVALLGSQALTLRDPGQRPHLNDGEKTGNGSHDGPASVDLHTAV